jgi:hypothetical protein
MKIIIDDVPLPNQKPGSGVISVKTEPDISALLDKAEKDLIGVGLSQAEAFGLWAVQQINAAAAKGPMRFGFSKPKPKITKEKN